MYTGVIEIPFIPVIEGIVIIWVTVRALIALIKREFHIKYELSQLFVLLVICIAVRFTFFPTFREDGAVGPLLFDAYRMKEHIISLEPFYYIKKLWYGGKVNFFINEVGNVLLFIPVGVVWPSVYKKLRAFWKTLIAGAAFSVIIEICQLPFYERTTDIDDVILNTLGCAIGYTVFALIRLLTRSGEKSE